MLITSEKEYKKLGIPFAEGHVYELQNLVNRQFAGGAVTIGDFLAMLEEIDDREVIRGVLKILLFEIRNYSAFPIGLVELLLENSDNIKQELCTCFEEIVVYRMYILWILYPLLHDAIAGLNSAVITNRSTVVLQIKKEIGAYAELVTHCTVLLALKNSEN